MKKIIILSFMFILISVWIFSQEPEKITVKTSDLTIDQLAKIKAQAEVETMQKKLETYGKWVGVGGEIGNAVKESLTAVVDVSDKFGKTDVGKFTMVMVGWKIIGKDLLRILFGIVFATIYTIFMFRYYKKGFTTYRIPIKDNGWKFWLPKEYHIVKEANDRNTSYDGYEVVKWLNIVMLIAGYAITYAIMFG